MAHQRFDLGEFSEDERLLASRPLDEVLRRAAALATVIAEEERAAESHRPTIPIFDGEPWR